jgi:hypothetical protein
MYTFKDFSFEQTQRKNAMSADRKNMPTRRKEKKTSQFRNTLEILLTTWRLSYFIMLIFQKKKKSRFEAIKENKTTQNGSWQNNH